MERGCTQAQLVSTARKFSFFVAPPPAAEPPPPSDEDLGLRLERNAREAAEAQERTAQVVAQKSAQVTLMTVVQ